MSKDDDHAARAGNNMAHSIRESILEAAHVSGDERAFWRAFQAGMTGACTAQCGGRYTGELFDALAAIARSQHIAGQPATPIQHRR